MAADRRVAELYDKVQTSRAARATIAADVVAAKAQLAKVDAQCTRLLLLQKKVRVLQLPHPPPARPWGCAATVRPWPSFGPRGAPPCLHVPVLSPAYTLRRLSFPDAT